MCKNLKKNNNSAFLFFCQMHKQAYTCTQWQLITQPFSPMKRAVVPDSCRVCCFLNSLIRQISSFPAEVMSAVLQGLNPSPEFKKNKALFFKKSHPPLSMQQVFHPHACWKQVPRCLLPHSFILQCTTTKTRATFWSIRDQHLSTLLEVWAPLLCKNIPSFGVSMSELSRWWSAGS